MGLKVGDRVKVVNIGHTYAQYYSWLVENNVDKDTLKKWVDNAFPKNGSEYTVKKIAPHLSFKEEIVLIEDNNSIFLMGTCDKSLQLVEESKVELSKKEDNFKIKALKDAGTYGQLKKGEGYEFINGRTTWSNGSVSSYYSSFDDLKDTCTWGNHCHIELTKEETEVESSKKEDNFKVKCNKSYCSSFWTEGKIYEFIDGYATWDNGDNSNYYLNYEDFVCCNGVSCRLDFEEYIEEVKEKGSGKEVAEEVEESRKVFDWASFKGSYNQRVHCETEEEAEVFCRLMHEHGLTWRTGGSYLKYTHWDYRGDCGIFYYGDGDFNDANKPIRESSTSFIFSNWFTLAGELKHIETKTTKISTTKTSAKPKPKAVPKVVKDSQKDSQKETSKQTTNKERVEENNMKNNLTAIFGETVGKIMDGMVAVTFGGEIAIKRNEDEYVRFNAATNTIENQMDFVMKEAADFLFLLPVNEVQAGDVIKKNNTYYQVVGTGKTGGLTVVGIKTGTRKTLIQETNIMGFSFYFKVVNLFSAMSGTGVSGINPMLLPMLLSDNEEDESMLLPMLMCGGMGALTGNAAGNTGIMGQGMNPMMMALMLGDKGKKGSGDSGIDMKSIMMMNMMGQQGQGAPMNPMMMALMMGNGKMDMKTMMMMNMMNQQQVQPVQAQVVQQTVKSEQKEDVVSSNPNVVTVPPVE